MVTKSLELRRSILIDDCSMASSVLSLASFLNDVPLDAQTISQDRLNIDEKVRSNLFPWIGQFSPQLVHELLKTYGATGDFVIDPFMGSGTVLVEAAGLRQRAFGSEINPAAYKMAQVYALVNEPADVRRSALERVSAALYDAFEGPSLFSKSDHGDHQACPRDRLLGVWEQQEECSAASRLVETLVVLLDVYKVDLSPQKILAMWRKLCLKIIELPFSAEPVELSNCDARSLPLGDGMVDLVVTSPPYINVFNYHQQYRASVEAMGWDLLQVARSEIGSNRKHRGNRFLTVIQYCRDIRQALEEMRRVCKPSARLILVLGRESSVRKTRFYNGDIVTRIGVRCVGLSAESRQERVFKNRFGTLIYEDIIHFRSAEAPQENDEAAHVAREVLTAALDYAPKESLDDLRDAINKAAEIQPSPTYRPTSAQPRQGE